MEVKIRAPRPRDKHFLKEVIVEESQRLCSMQYYWINQPQKNGSFWTMEKRRQGCDSGFGCAFREGSTGLIVAP